MNTTVQDLMSIPSPSFLGVGTLSGNEPTMSKKAWTEELHALNPQYTATWHPTTQAIDKFLGPGSDRPTSANFVGLQTAANHLNTLLQLVSTEGDVTRDFDQNIIPSVALAFSGDSAVTIPASGEPHPSAPKLWSRSLAGPTGLTSCPYTIDFQMTMRHQEPLLELAAVVGEMKKPGIIKPNEWLFREEPTRKTTLLQRELRAYASEYRCSQIFVFDATYLVIVQFKASSPEDIAKENCPVDVCVIPRVIDGSYPHQCSMQYALYRLAWRGWVRLCATLESQVLSPRRIVRVEKPLSLRGFTRKYEYWSGRPVWYNALHSPSMHHPDGYWRDFAYISVQQQDGTVETEGVWGWKHDELETFEVDTRNCFT